MLIEPQYISYKDPDARVVKTEQGYLRYISNAYKNQYDHLMNSGPYEALVNKELLISHKEIELETKEVSIYKLILPEQIYFQSYPFEWSYTQWRSAIFAYLKINQIALAYGMILKDATPYNFFLRGGRAILFDTSSFIFFNDNDPWIAYRQFCENFSGPLALMKYNGAKWSKLVMSELRGLPLQFVSKQLPLKSWLNITCFLHIHMHAKYEYTKKTNTSIQKGFSIAKMDLLLEMFRNTVKSWKAAPIFNDNWINYYEERIESPEYLKSKIFFFTEWLLTTNPFSVLDLGSNTGVFPLLAAGIAKEVIAAEFENTCVDRIEHEIREKNIKNITTLVTDLSETSPSLGMLNKELTSFINRGKSEMVVALALIHHLCIAKNLSMTHVAELFSTLSLEYLIVEYIPKDDPKVRILLESRQDIFNGYNEHNFINQFSIHFDFVKKIQLDQTERLLYLWKKKWNQLLF